MACEKDAAGTVVMQEIRAAGNSHELVEETRLLTVERQHAECHRSLYQPVTQILLRGPIGLGQPGQEIDLARVLASPGFAGAVVELMLSQID